MTGGGGVSKRCMAHRGGGAPSLPFAPMHTRTCARPSRARRCAARAAPRRTAGRRQLGGAPRRSRRRAGAGRRRRRGALHGCVPAAAAAHQARGGAGVRVLCRGQGAAGWLHLRAAWSRRCCIASLRPGLVLGCALLPCPRLLRALRPRRGQAWAAARMGRWDKGVQLGAQAAGERTARNRCASPHVAPRLWAPPARPRAAQAKLDALCFPLRPSEASIAPLEGPEGGAGSTGAAPRGGGGKGRLVGPMAW